MPPEGDLGLVSTSGAAVASGSNAPSSLKGLIGMVVYPSRLSPHSRSQIEHNHEGSSNIILAMLQFGIPYSPTLWFLGALIAPLYLFFELPQQLGNPIGQRLS
jgi:hypothetical protein